jgi:hypothetical protein
MQVASLWQNLRHAKAKSQPLSGNRVIPVTFLGSR